MKNCCREHSNFPGIQSCQKKLEKKSNLLPVDADNAKDPWALSEMSCVYLWGMKGLTQDVRRGYVMERLYG